MKRLFKLLVISATSSIAVFTATAGSAHFTANTNGGSQSTGISVIVPAGAYYQYHVYAFGPGGGSAYFSFHGAGVAVSDSTSGPVKTGAGTCPSGGQIYGSCTAQNGGNPQNSAEAGVSFSW